MSEEKCWDCGDDNLLGDFYKVEYTVMNKVIKTRHYCLHCGVHKHELATLWTAEELKKEGIE